MNTGIEGALCRIPKQRGALSNRAVAPSRVRLRCPGVGDSVPSNPELGPNTYAVALSRRPATVLLIFRELRWLCDAPQRQFALVRAASGGARTDTIIAAYDRGLASADDRVAMTAADTLLDRYLGRPTAVTESQPPGTQAYVELRRTLDLLPPEERLDYLRECRMAAAIAATPQLPAQVADRPVNPNPDSDPAPRELVKGQAAHEG